jgi:hypothetical protein
MRRLMHVLALAILAIGTISIESAAAQTYDPAYPVCLHVFTVGANYYECRYTSLPQCNASASGRAAQCVINPYFAKDYRPLGALKKFWRRLGACRGSQRAARGDVAACALVNWVTWRIAF